MTAEEAGNEREYAAPKKAYTVEFFVGLFLLIGLGCFAFIAINIAQMKFFETGYYNVRAEFTNISGLEVGAPVELAGVQIGEVKRISLNDTIAAVILSVRDEVKLRDDDIASIRTKGIIGDRYVRITPGASDNAVKENGTISDTESTMDIEEIIGKIIHRMDDKE